MPDRVIVRLPNWLGDTVMAVPALRAVRAAWPDARVLAAGPWASTLAGQGLADVLLTFPRAWSGRLRSADVGRDFRAEIALVLPNSFESALTARYWRAPRRVGFAAGGRRWLLTDAPPLPSPRRHQIDEYLVLVEALGARAPSPVPELTAPGPEAEERQDVRGWLDALDLPPGPRCAIHLGAAYGAAKVWPAARVIECVRELGARGVRVVLLGPGDDSVAASEIVAATGAASLVGRDRPSTLPALLTEIDVLVSGDTGVAHLAAALGTPVVTLFGPTDPRLTAPRPLATLTARGGSVVRHSVPCAPCFYRTCPIDHPCMRGISAADVAARVVELARAAVVAR